MNLNKCSEIRKVSPASDKIRALAKAITQAGLSLPIASLNSKILQFCHLLLNIFIIILWRFEFNHAG